MKGPAGYELPTELPSLLFHFQSVCASSRPPLLLYELEALCLVVWKSGLKQHRVHPELRVEQRHVPIHLHEEVDALVALVEVRIVVREGLRAAGTAEGPARRHLMTEKQTKINQGYNKEFILLLSTNLTIFVINVLYNSH